MTQPWHARLDWISHSRVDEDAAFEVLDALTGLAPAGELSADGLSGCVSITVEADDLDGALSTSLESFRAALSRHCTAARISGVEVLCEEAFDRELARPLFPEVVGYAEIAELAGVSRQRARAFSKLVGFPRPVIETAQGPLMSKAAIVHWIEHRNTRPGRPRRVRSESPETNARQ